MLRVHALRSYWTPIGVLALGALTAAMLIWTQKIGEGVRADIAIEGALMDAQINTSICHLWFEEGLGGDSHIDLAENWKHFDHARQLLTVILEGGTTEHDPVIQPLDDSAKRDQVKQLMSLLDQFREIGRERERSPEQSGIGSDADTRFDNVFGLFMEKARDLEMEVKKRRAIRQIRSAQLYWSMVLVWFAIVLVATSGLFGLERRRRSAEEALRQSNERLLAQTNELLRHRDHLATLVDEGTLELQGVNESLREEITERQKVEHDLRCSESELQSLSARILTAQEEERGRLSRELHDELGQALATLKLRIGFIEKREDREELKAECKNVLEYLDEVMENTRRLSRGLSPSILEHFGLSAALKRLISDFVEDHGIDLSLDMNDQLGKLLSKRAQIIVYRVFQEALNNVGKHAGATSLLVRIDMNGDGVHFLLEDNGTGFDMNPKTTRNLCESGLGLVIMQERVRMLGGTLSLWSEKGKGARVSFDIPALARNH